MTRSHAVTTSRACGLTSRKVYRLLAVLLVCSACTDKAAVVGPVHVVATPTAAPATQPLLLFADSKALHAMSWSGNEYALPPNLPRSNPSFTSAATPVTASPDGWSLLGPGNTLWSHGALVKGRPAPPAGMTRVVWADDSSHLCGMVPKPDNQSQLWVADPGGNWTRIATRGSAVMNTSTPEITACSWTAKRIAVAAAGGWLSGESWIFDWTGKLLQHLSAPPKSTNAVTFSHDLSRLAAFDEATNQTTVRDANGATVAVLPHEVLYSFSWDGNYALAFDTTYIDAWPPVHNPFEVEVRTGRTVWTSPAGSMIQQFAPVAAEPGGDALAMTLQNSDCGGTNGACNPSLWVVSPRRHWSRPGVRDLAWPAIWPAATS